MRTNAKGSTSYLMNQSTHWSNWKRKQDNLNHQILNLITFCFKPKEITQILLKKWKIDNQLSIKQTKSWKTLTNKMKIWNNTQPNLRRNVKRLKLNIKIYVKTLIRLSSKTKIFPWDLKAWKILSETVKVNLINQLSNENNWEMNIWN